MIKKKKRRGREIIRIRDSIDQHTYTRHTSSYLDQFFTAFMTMLVLTHHPSYIHVHFIIDLCREISIVYRVSAVAQAPMLL